MARKKKTPEAVETDNVTPIAPELPPAVVPVVSEKVRELAGKSKEENLMRAIVTEMMPAFLVAAREMMTPQAPAAVAAQERAGRCPECQQNLKGCKGEHVMMVVYPTKDPAQNGQWFQGCFINGVRYLSDGPDQVQAVLVPKNCEGDIKHQIAKYEDNEQQLARGRKAYHNSGDLSSPQKANAAWR